MSAAQDQAYQPKAKVIEHPALNPNGFDLRVHIKDANTGEMLRVQPYNLHIISGRKYYERPVGSGNVFFESNQPAGRLVAGEVQLGAAHIAYEGPEQRIATLEAVAEENESLRKELASLRAENEAKMKLKDEKAVTKK